MMQTIEHRFRSNGTQARWLDRAAVGGVFLKAEDYMFTQNEPGFVFYKTGITDPAQT